ncbi:hypothetical protein [Halioxenophilus aromaticivorans]|uniref:DUF3568 family protein n=1 Tax=Halioxenophilus aromaticivorans TaxID=1306992 RepID=A0AAV3U9U6_9ALTE
MNNKLIAVSVLWLSTSACHTYASQCAENFSVEGNFLKGKTFKTWEEIASLNSQDAFKKIYQHIAQDGWKITNADEKLGIISASQDVSFGEGKTAPLNIVLEENGSYSRVSISYSISGGVSSPKKAVLKSFCDTIAAAKKP